MLNEISLNIIKSLCGNYVSCDLETTALKPAEGLIISMACVPFDITMNDRGIPTVNIQGYDIKEWWNYAIDKQELNLLWGNEQTRQWHIEKNEAFPFYLGLANDARGASRFDRNMFFTEFFKDQQASFLSRHAFDANWIAYHYPQEFETINYRKFVDISSLIKGMGFEDRKLYKELEAKAIEGASTYQRYMIANSVIPNQTIFYKHRAVSDCLIDIFLLKEMLDYIWQYGE